MIFRWCTVVIGHWHIIHWRLLRVLLWVLLWVWVMGWSMAHGRHIATIVHTWVPGHHRSIRSHHWSILVHVHARRAIHAWRTIHPWRPMHSVWHRTIVSHHTRGHVGCHLLPWTTHMSRVHHTIRHHSRVSARMTARVTTWTHIVAHHVVGRPTVWGTMWSHVLLVMRMGMGVMGER